MQHDVIANDAAVTDDGSGVNVAAVADSDIGSDDRERMDVGVGADVSRFVDNGTCRDPDGGALAGWSQNAGDGQECRLRLGYQNEGAIFRGWQFGTNAVRHNDQTGGSVFESGEVFLVTDEGEIAGGSAFEDLDVVDFDIRVSQQLSVQRMSDFRGRQGLSRRCCRHQALRRLLVPELSATSPPYGLGDNRRAVQRVGEDGRDASENRDSDARRSAVAGSLPGGVAGNGTADRSGFWDLPEPAASEQMLVVSFTGTGDRTGFKETNCLFSPN